MNNYLYCTLSKFQSLEHCEYNNQYIYTNIPISVVCVSKFICCCCLVCCCRRQHCRWRRRRRKQFPFFFSRDNCSYAISTSIVFINQMFDFHCASKLHLKVHFLYHHQNCIILSDLNSWLTVNTSYILFFSGNESKFIKSIECYSTLTLFEVSYVFDDIYINYYDACVFCHFCFIDKQMMFFAWTKQFNMTLVQLGKPKPKPKPNNHKL